MTAFFSCIILIGIGLCLFSFFLILAEKKRMYDIRADLREKKDELFQVIEDTETLIQEMNHFSDYVVSRCEEKQEALKAAVKEADQRISLLHDETQASDVHPVPVMVRSAVQSSPVMFHADPVQRRITPILDIAAVSSVRPGSGRVLPLTMRCEEVMKLKNKGFDHTSIARHLNMGKGEIDLIARIGRQEVL